MPGIVIIGSLAIAALLDWKSVGPRWLSDRIAFVLALTGLTGALEATRIGGLLEGVAGWAEDRLGVLLANLSAPLGQAVADYGVAMVASVALLVAAGCLLPKRAAKRGGEFATLEFSSGTIWGISLILAVFTSSIPGTLGDLANDGKGQGTEVGSSITRTVLD